MIENVTSGVSGYERIGAEDYVMIYGNELTCLGIGIGNETGEVIGFETLNDSVDDHASGTEISTGNLNEGGHLK